MKNDILNEKVKKWIDKANKDLERAKRSFEFEDYEECLFHAQQAAEKFLKAFLTKFQIDFKKTHDIYYLISLCKIVDKSFEYLIEIKAHTLFPKGIDVRYPEIEDVEEISQEEAKEAIEIAEKVKEFVLKKLKEKLE
ncbi:MAG: HEPN domain-containing protein [Candidatus Aenigmatarchaeota archaeon]